MGSVWLKMPAYADGNSKEIATLKTLDASDGWSGATSQIFQIGARGCAAT